MAFTRLFGRFRATTLLTISGIAAIVRWIAYPLVWPLGLGVPGFFAVQALHGLSTGILLIGMQKLIAETVDEQQTGAAQGAAFFATGVCMAIVTLLSGPLYHRFGADGFFAMIGVALAGLVLVQLSAASAPERRRRR